MSEKLLPENEAYKDNGKEFGPIDEKECIRTNFRIQNTPSEINKSLDIDEPKVEYLNLEIYLTERQ